jgi:AcrR family transcriptional regulator
MISEPLSTRDRILQAAIQLFVDQGIRRVSMDDVARRSGVSRVTLYRYFLDRESLVKAAFFSPIVALERLQDEMTGESDLSVEGVLVAIGERIAGQPAIDLPVHREELETLYPRAPGVRQDLIEGVIWDLMVNPHAIPAVRHSGLPARELYSTLIDVLLHGVLTDTT